MIFSTSASNFFHCFYVSFFTCFVHGRELFKYLVLKIILVQSAHKSNKVYNKFKTFDFLYTHIPFRSATSKTVSPKNCGVA